MHIIEYGGTLWNMGDIMEFGGGNYGVAEDSMDSGRGHRTSVPSRPEFQVNGPQEQVVCLVIL
jgi:hypothetical protein